MQLKAVEAGKLLPFVILLLPQVMPKKENGEPRQEGYQSVPPTTNIDPHATLTKRLSEFRSRRTWKRFRDGDSATALIDRIGHDPRRRDFAVSLADATRLFAYHDGKIERHNPRIRKTPRSRSELL
jgi:hypothetical protein